MGLFSFIGNVVSGIGSVVSNIASAAVEGVKWVGEKIGGLFSSNERTATVTSRQESYQPATATAEQTRQVNHNLDEYKNDVSTRSEEIEDRIADDCEEMFDKLADSLNAMNNTEIAPGIVFKIDNRQLQRESRKLLRSIRGSIKREVMPNISIGNSKCLQILEMNAGSAKKNAMKKFIDDGITNALKSLKNNLKDGLKDAIENTNDMLDNKFVQVESIAQSSLDVLNTLKENTNANKKEQTQIELAEKLCINQYALKLLKYYKLKS